VAGKLDGTAVGAFVAGTIFVYAGLTGKSVLASIQSVVSGKSPKGLANANPIQGTGNPDAATMSPAAISGSVSGSAIASDAVRYAGHAYLYGGAPGPNGTSPWDCSSFCNWVLSHDMRMSIPGGAWDPSTHGPATGSYLGFGTGISRSQVAAGDLIVWPTHMGIALNNTQMISALNPGLGTQVTGIENGGPQGESLVCRRVA
jgi:cell wall-associated NlpC family hydrolase